MVKNWGSEVNQSDKTLDKIKKLHFNQQIVVDGKGLIFDSDSIYVQSEWKMDGLDAAAAELHGMTSFPLLLAFPEGYQHCPWTHSSLVILLYSSVTDASSSPAQRLGFWNESVIYSLKSPGEHQSLLHPCVLLPRSLSPHLLRTNAANPGDLHRDVSSLPREPKRLQQQSPPWARRWMDPVRRGF